nr:hypothetical protein [Tanacetum cinerariifolium]
MRIPLLYRGEYSRWRERFMNYLEEQTDSEEMINSIQNGDQPLPVIALVKETAKDLWDALERQMRSSEYAEKDRKAAILYEYETFKATEGEQLLDTYLRYLQIINDLKKCGYKKDNYPLALVAEKTKVSKRKVKVVVSLDSEDSEASSSSADEKIFEVSYYLSESESESEYETSEYYDTTTTYVVDHNDSKGIDKLIKKINKKIVKCQKRIEKANQQRKDFENQNKDLQDKYDVLKNQATIFEMNNKELNEQLKVLIEKNDDLLAQTKVLKDQLQVKHVVIDIHVECQEKYVKLEAERYEYMIRYSAYFDNDKQNRKQIADQEVLFNKMSVQLVELDKNVKDLKNTILEKDFKIFELEECVRNKDLEIEKCLERLNVCESKLHKMSQTNQTVHMIMPAKDILYNGQKGTCFEKANLKTIESLKSKVF